MGQSGASADVLLGRRQLPTGEEHERGLRASPFASRRTVRGFDCRLHSFIGHRGKSYDPATLVSDLEPSEKTTLEQALVDARQLQFLEVLGVTRRQHFSGLNFQGAWSSW